MPVQALMVVVPVVPVAARSCSVHMVVLVGKMVSVVPGLLAGAPSAMEEMAAVAMGEALLELVAMAVAAVGAAGLVTGALAAVAVALAEEVGEALAALAGLVAALVLPVQTTLRLRMVGLLGKTPPRVVMAPFF